MTIKTLIRNPQLLSLAGNALAAGAGFLSVMLLARTQSPADLGTWMLYLTAWSFFDMVRSGLVQTALVKYYASTQEAGYAGAAWMIISVFTGAVSLLIGLGNLAFSSFIKDADVRLLLTQFPWLLISTVPYGIASWIQQAHHRFDRLLWMRLAFTFPFLAFVTTSYYFHWTISDIGWAQTIIYTICSLIFLPWSEWKAWALSTKKHVSDLLHFGKYSIGTLLCANLLKSSDTILLGIYLSPAAVAAFNLPYKLIEVVEIPLRSVAATAFPQMSRLLQTEGAGSVRALLIRQLKMLTLVLIPLSIACYIFAEPLVVLLGGEAYRSSASFFRVFAIYSLFLPADRFIGVAIDSLGMPQVNTLKVFLMVLVNVIGDIIALQLTQEPLAVAIVTVVTVLTGVIVGAYFLRSSFNRYAPA